MIIVLVTTGKHESVDTAKVRQFETTWQAEDFCQQTNTGRVKHWKLAQIVREFEEVELVQPEE